MKMKEMQKSRPKLKLDQFWEYSKNTFYTDHIQAWIQINEICTLCAQVEKF